ncbi:Exonuclease_1 [Hexamita inflata]|uniref:Exonuclease 1 n=1 Tax=Hexamita inflata TaxID=28002 RepID=A0AA86UNY5_9EUKA|nr:Exonuclease 1 [Hexamita inflata]
MGIPGLLQAIERGKEMHIKNLKGQSIVVDGHCFLHRSCIFAPEQVVLQDDVSRIVKYMIGFIDNVHKHTAAPVVLVFDGGQLPLKKLTDESRRESREEHLRMYKSLIKSDPREARKHMMSAFTITSNQLSRISAEISETYKSDSWFTLMHSPYEADAQVAFLHNAGLADVIMTIDSDILLYNPSKVLFAYDPKECVGRLVTNEDIYAKDFKNMTMPQIQRTCVLSGCDYVSSLFGVALKTSLSALKQNDFNLKPAINYLHVDLNKQLQNYTTVSDYYNQVLRALLCFQFHVIYNPISNTLEHYFPLQNTEMETLSKLGTGFFGQTTENVNKIFGGNGNAQIQNKIKNVFKGKTEKDFRKHKTDYFEELQMFIVSKE